MNKLDKLFKTFSGRVGTSSSGTPKADAATERSVQKVALGGSWLEFSEIAM